MGVDHHVPIVVGHLVHQVVAEDAGAGHQDVDVFALVGRGPEERLDGGAIGHVAGDRQRAAAAAADLLGDGFCRLAIQVGDDDGGTLGSEAGGGGGADAASATRHQRGAALEAPAHEVTTSASPSVTC